MKRTSIKDWENHGGRGLWPDGSPVCAPDIFTLRRVVEEMSDEQLSFLANAFKRSGQTEPHAIVIGEIERRCVMAYVSEGLGE
jgi:hypothetical protein